MDYLNRRSNPKVNNIVYLCIFVYKISYLTFGNRQAYQQNNKGTHFYCFESNIKNIVRTYIQGRGKIKLSSILILF